MYSHKRRKPTHKRRFSATIKYIRQTLSVTNAGCINITSMENKPTNIAHLKKKLILIGTTASGKTTIKNELKDRGYTLEISYTSREKRDNEIDGVDYHFIEGKEFEKLIAEGKFLQYTLFKDKNDPTKDNYYGTLINEFSNKDVFIMNASAVTNMPKEYRNRCVVVFTVADLETTINRLKSRGDDAEMILNRLIADEKEFSTHKDCDMQINTTTEGVGSIVNFIVKEWESANGSI